MAKGAAFFVLVLALAFVFLMDSAYSDDSAYEAGSKIKETAHDLKHKTEDFFKGIFGRLAKNHHHHVMLTLMLMLMHMFMLMVQQQQYQYQHQQRPPKQRKLKLPAMSREPKGLHKGLHFCN
ncbi:uncharacterized protein LOC122084404 isoform X1 [Macadamia integrifolia]|uniref:uncharacterized protein LOC122084404 isoform X1 n=1 Tax=Macadamia integrifolia TaxID=60698 RepID=UPI001C4E7F75|nr:uncharacterized protein LOC122084404 isoform X1 [Macadamia integrifolia]